MAAILPQMVDIRNPTFSGLQKSVQLVDLPPMAQAQHQYQDIGARLQAVRKAFSDLGQSAWADRHGFTPTQYNNWEKGARRIPVDEAERLCTLYGLTLDFIYRGRRDGLSTTASNVL